MTDQVGKAVQPQRAFWPAVRHGLMGRCPACGSGRLFHRFLKPVDHCEACGEAIHHHRADDLPAYLVIVVVGHVMMSGYMMTDMVFEASPWLHLAIWAPLSVLAALVSIQPIKGAVIGLQWALRMHGFADEHAQEAGWQDHGPRK